MFCNLLQFQTILEMIFEISWSENKWGTNENQFSCGKFWDSRTDYRIYLPLCNRNNTLLHAPFIRHPELVLSLVEPQIPNPSLNPKSHNIELHSMQLRAIVCVFFLPNQSKLFKRSSYIIFMKSKFWNGE